jgi:hypothetical protein
MPRRNTVYIRIDNLIIYVNVNITYSCIDDKSVIMNFFLEDQNQNNIFRLTAPKSLLLRLEYK